MFYIRSIIVWLVVVDEWKKVDDSMAFYEWCLPNWSNKYSYQSFFSRHAFIWLSLNQNNFRRLLKQISYTCICLKRLIIYNDEALIIMCLQKYNHIRTKATRWNSFTQCFEIQFQNAMQEIIKSSHLSIYLLNHKQRRKNGDKLRRWMRRTESWRHLSVFIKESCWALW